MGLGLSTAAGGPDIDNYAFQDVSNFSRILDRVAVWDKSTTNPYPVHDKDKWMNVNKAIEQMYSDLRVKNEKFIQERASKESKAWLAAMEMRFQTESVYPDFMDLKAKLAAESNALEGKARLAAPIIERMYAANTDPHCREGQVDPANVAKETAKEKALVSDYVKINPDVIRDTGEIKNTWVEYGLTRSTYTMPYRYEVGVISAAGKESHAIIDVLRTDGEVKFTLLCIARLRWVSRDVHKDPCSQ